MIDLIYSLIKNEKWADICVAWSRSTEIDKLATMTSLSPDYIKSEVERMINLGILKIDGTVDVHVEKYIEQIVANKIRLEKGV